MQIVILIDVTADGREASVAVNPYGYGGSYQAVRPKGGSVDEARAGHDVLGQAILFAKTINGFANKLEG